MISIKILEWFIIWTDSRTSEKSMESGMLWREKKLSLPSATPYSSLRIHGYLRGKNWKANEPDRTKRGPSSSSPPSQAAPSTSKQNHATTLKRAGKNIGNNTRRWVIKETFWEVPKYLANYSFALGWAFSAARWERRGAPSSGATERSRATR